MNEQSQDSLRNLGETIETIKKALNKLEKIYNEMVILMDKEGV